MDSISSKINEPLLREYDQAGAITGAKIVRTADGYVLVVQVSWKRGNLTVYNQRGKPRAWASLDRLLSYLNEMVPSVTQFELVLDETLELPDELVPAAKAVVTPAKKHAAKASAKGSSKPKPAGKASRKATHA